MAAILLLVRAAISLEFYVDSINGNDMNSGNASFPWRTVRKFSQLSIPGSSNVYFRGTFNDTLYVPLDRVMGSTAKPVKYTSWIDSQPPLFLGNPGIKVYHNTTGSSPHLGLEFDNLRLQSMLPNTIPNQTAYGLHVTSSVGYGGYDYLVLSRLSVVGYYLGIVTECTAINGAVFTNVSLRDSNFSDCYLGTTLTGILGLVAERLNFDRCFAGFSTGAWSYNILARDINASNGTYGVYIASPASDVVLQRCHTFNNSGLGYYFTAGTSDPVSGLNNITLIDSDSTNDGSQVKASIGLYGQDGRGPLRNYIIRNMNIRTTSPCQLYTNVFLSTHYAGVLQKGPAYGVLMENVQVSCGTSQAGTVTGTSVYCETNTTGCVTLNGIMSTWVGDYQIGQPRVLQTCPTGHVITQWNTPNNGQRLGQTYAQCSDGTVLWMKAPKNTNSTLSTTSPYGFRPADLFLRVNSTTTAYPVAYRTTQVKQFMNVGFPSPSSPQFLFDSYIPDDYSVVGVEMQYSANSTSADLTAIRFLFQDGSTAVQLKSWNSSSPGLVQSTCPNGTFLNTIYGLGSQCTTTLQGVCSDGTILADGGESVLVNGFQNLTGFLPYDFYPYQGNGTCTSLKASVVLPNLNEFFVLTVNFTFLTWPVVVGFATEPYPNNPSSLNVQLIAKPVTPTTYRDDKWSMWYGVQSGPIQSVVTLGFGYVLMGLQVTLSTARATFGERGLQAEGVTYPTSSLTNSSFHGRFNGGYRRSDLGISTTNSQAITSLLPGVGVNRTSAVPVTDIPSDALITSFHRQGYPGALSFVTMIRFGYTRGWFSRWMTSNPLVSLEHHSECPAESIITTLRLRKHCFLQTIQAVCSDGTVLNSLWGSLSTETIDIINPAGFRPQDLQVRASLMVVEINGLGPSSAMPFEAMGPRAKSTRDLLIGFQVQGYSLDNLRFLFSDVSTVSDWFGGAGTYWLGFYCTETYRIVSFSILRDTNGNILAFQGTCSDGQVSNTGRYTSPNLLTGTQVTTFTAPTSGGFRPSLFSISSDNNSLMSLRMDGSRVYNDNTIDLPDYLSLVGVEVEVTPLGVHKAVRFNFTAVPDAPLPLMNDVQWGEWAACGGNGLNPPLLCPQNSYITSWAIASSDEAITGVQAMCSDGSTLSPPFKSSIPFSVRPFLAARPLGYQSRDVMVRASAAGALSMLGVGPPGGSLDGMTGQGAEGGAVGVPENWVVVGFRTSVENTLSNIQFAYRDQQINNAAGNVTYDAVMEPQMQNSFQWTGPTFQGLSLWTISSSSIALYNATLSLPSFTLAPGNYRVTLTGGGNPIAQVMLWVVDYPFVCDIQQTYSGEFGRGMVILHAVCEEEAGPTENLIFHWVTSFGASGSGPTFPFIPAAQGWYRVDLTTNSLWSGRTVMSYANITYPTGFFNVSLVALPAINPQDTLFLKVSVDGSAPPLQYQWSTTTPTVSVVLDDPSLVQPFNSNCFVPPTSSEIVTVDPSCLTPGGIYTFSVTVMGNGIFNVPTRTVTVRTPPRDGTCSLRQVDSYVDVECSGWRTQSPYLLYSLMTNGNSPSQPSQTFVAPQRQSAFTAFIPFMQSGPYLFDILVSTPQLAAAITNVSITLTPVVDFPTLVQPEGWATFQWLGASVGNPSQLQWTIAGIYTYTGVLVQMPPFTLIPGVYTIMVTLGGQNMSLESFQVTNYTLSVGIQQTAAYDGVVELIAVWPDQQANVSVQWSGPCVTIGSASKALHLVKDPSQPSTCTVTVTATSPFTIGAQTAQLTITFPSVLAVYNATVDGPVVSNPQSTLRLLGSAQSSLTLTYKWSVTPTITGDPSVCFLGGGTLRALVIGPNCMIPGTTYIFVFNATTPTSETASATQTVYIRPLPTGGTCSVIQPDPSVARVAASCIGWQTDSPYLVYSLTSATVPAGLALSVGDPQTTSSFFVNLAPGLQDVQVDVATPLGATAFSTLTRLNITGACVFSNGTQSLADASYLIRCNASEAAWNALRNSVSSTFQKEYVSESELLQIAAALGDLLNSAPTSQISSDDFRNQLLGYLNNLTVLSGGSIGPQVAATVSASLDQALATLPCNLLDPLLVTLQTMSGKLNTVALPGEPTSVQSLSFQTLSSSAQYSGTGLGSAAYADGTSIGVSVPPTSVPSAAGNVVYLSVTQYSSALSRCRTSTSGTLIGGISDVTVYNNEGNAQVIKGVSNPIVLNFGVGRPRCQHVGCVWWDSMHGDWSEAGCTGTAVSPTSYACSCTHLTEFTLVAAGCPTDPERAGYALFIAIYSILGVVTVAKLFYRILLDRRTRQSTGSGSHSVKLLYGWTSAHTQHILITIHCLLRALSCATLGQYIVMDMAQGRSALLLGPYLLIFWVYTILVFNWAALTHFTMSFNEKQWRLNVSLVVTNVAVLAAVMVLLVKMNPASTANTNENESAVVLAGTIVLASLTFITALAFSVYGVLLYSKMAGAHSTKSQSSFASRDSTTGHHKSHLSLAKKLNLRQKLLVFGLISSVLLFVQSVLHVVTAVSPAYSPNTGELVLLAVDSLFVMSLLLLYHSFMVNSRK